MIAALALLPLAFARQLAVTGLGVLDFKFQGACMGCI